MSVVCVGARAVRYFETALADGATSAARQLDQELGVAIELMDARGVAASEARHRLHIGMTPEQVRKLFQEFSQAEATTAHRFGGMA